MMCPSLGFAVSRTRTESQEMISLEGIAISRTRTESQEMISLEGITLHGHTLGADHVWN